MTQYPDRRWILEWVKYIVRSPKFIWAPVYSCTHWLRPRNTPPPPSAFGLMKALLVSQDIRHLFVTLDLNHAVVNRHPVRVHAKRHKKTVGAINWTADERIS
jgi:hypothetical protein